MLHTDVFGGRSGSSELACVLVVPLEAYIYIYIERERYRRIYIYIYTPMCIHIYIYIYTYVHAYIYIYMYRCVYMYIYIYVYVYLEGPNIGCVISIAAVHRYAKYELCAPHQIEAMYCKCPLTDPARATAPAMRPPGAQA